MTKHYKLETVLATLRKSHGDEFLQEAIAGSVYPTGLEVLDYITGIGGIPVERITELYSAEGCGKSTLAMQIAAAVQKLGKTVVWVDYEQCFTNTYATTLGLATTTPELVLLRPACAEDGFDSMLRLFRVSNIGLMVVDFRR